MSYFNDFQQNLIGEAVRQSGYSVAEIAESKDKQEAIVNPLIYRMLGKKEEIEIFFALFSMVHHYDRDSFICFPLKRSFRYRFDKIENFEGLLSFWEENSDVDFSILSDDGLRQFQMKRYTKEDLSTESFYKFIVNCLAEYGHNLGDTNLLIIIGTGGDLKDLSFDELNERISHNSNIRNCGDILITYNDANSMDVIERVYPERGSSQVPHRS